MEAFDLTIQAVEKAFETNHLTGSAEIYQKILDHLSVFSEENQKLNLTAIKDPIGMLYKHDVDALLAAKDIPEGARVLDIGCGGGIPSIPLAIYRPDLTVVGLDSTAKKIESVNRCCERLKVENCAAVAGRAEDPEIRKKLGLFDVVISRAVAKCNVLNEISFPYLKTGGLFIAMKAKTGAEEAEEARNGFEQLGGAAPEVIGYRLIESEEESDRSLILSRKIKETPSKYPRPYTQIVKKPL